MSADRKAAALSHPPMPFKVYAVTGERFAAFVHAEDAAAFVMLLGDGACVRHGRATIWTQGDDSDILPEGYGYDIVAEIMWDRVARSKERPS